MDSSTTHSPLLTEEENLDPHVLIQQTATLLAQIQATLAADFQTNVATSVDTNSCNLPMSSINSLANVDVSKFSSIATAASAQEHVLLPANILVGGTTVQETGVVSDTRGVVCHLADKDELLLPIKVEQTDEAMVSLQEKGRTEIPSSECVMCGQAVTGKILTDDTAEPMVSSIICGQPMVSSVTCDQQMVSNVICDQTMAGISTSGQITTSALTSVPISGTASNTDFLSLADSGTDTVPTQAQTDGQEYAFVLSNSPSATAPEYVG